MSDRKEALNLDPAPPRAIAVVPARLNATRLARKPLADLGGAPLIVRVCQNLTRSGVFAQIIVACDDGQIADAVAGAGYRFVMTDPALPSGTDRVAACAKTAGIDDDALIVNVQGDEPFVTTATLTAVVDLLALSGRDEIVTARESILDPRDLADRNLVKIAVGEHDRALYFSRAGIPFERDRDPAAASLAHHFRHIGIYAYRHSTLRAITRLPQHSLERLEQLEQLRWLASGYVIRAALVAPQARGVDTAADLSAANVHYLNLKDE